MGTLQALNKNKALKKKSSPSIWFLYINQYWWSFYAIVSLPLIAYQFSYWLPPGGFTEVMTYAFRWFTLVGPFYVLYKIPEWGISVYNIFGVLSGVISVFLIFMAIRMFERKVTFKDIFAVFLYFPYSIFLNLIILASLARLRFLKKRYFID